MNDNLSTGGSDLGQSSTADRLREKASGLTGVAKKQASSLFDKQKMTAASEVTQLAEALRRAGDELQGSRIAGALITTAADRLQAIGSNIENRTLDDLKDDVERFARRNPAIFIGGAVLIGAIAARFLKSHGPMSAGGGLYPERGRVSGDIETPIATTPASAFATDFGSGSAINNRNTPRGGQA